MFHKFLYPYYLFTSKVDHFYHFFQRENLFGMHSSFINFGYWANVSDYDVAAKTLAQRLGDYTVLKPHQTILTVGCGFGDELIFFVAHYSLDKAIGININFNQLKVGSTAKKDDRILFCQADAKTLCFQNNTFDAILALESAFHFDSREHFFTQSYLALKPGGILSLADIVLTSHKFNLIQKMLLKLIYRIYKIPSKNRQTWPEYLSSLQKTGFTHIERKEISRRVFQGFGVYLFRKKTLKSMFVKIVLGVLGLLFSGKFPFSYIFVRSAKPEIL